MNKPLRKRAIKLLNAKVIEAKVSDFELMQACVGHCLESTFLRVELEEELYDQYLPHGAKALDFLLLTPEQVVKAFTQVAKTEAEMWD